MVEMTLDREKEKRSGEGVMAMLVDDAHTSKGTDQTRRFGFELEAASQSDCISTAEIDTKHQTSTINALSSHRFRRDHDLATL